MNTIITIPKYQSTVKTNPFYCEKILFIKYLFMVAIIIVSSSMNIVFAGNLHKCTNKDGKITYTDKPCVSGENSTTLKTAKTDKTNTNISSTSTSSTASTSDQSNSKNTKPRHSREEVLEMWGMSNKDLVEQEQLCANGEVFTKAAACQTIEDLYTKNPADNYRDIQEAGQKRCKEGRQLVCLALEENAKQIEAFKTKCSKGDKKACSMLKRVGM